MFAPSVKPLRAVITALSPIAHGAFSDVSIGNAIACRRERIVSLPGFPPVPCISGNAIRGCARRLVMRELFAVAGISRAVFEAEGKAKAWDRLYAALANGGHLEAADTRVDPSKVRALRTELPPLSVFGAALYGSFLPGLCSFHFAWPRCRETLEAKLVTVGADVAAEDLVSESSFCRHVDREQQDPTQSGVTPMPVTVEVVATGAIFECVVTFTANVDDVQRGVIARGLELISGLGGKGAAGLGRVQVAHDGDSAPYGVWLERNKATLGATLRALADRLTAPAKDEEKAEKRGGKKAAAAPAPVASAPA